MKMYATRLYGVLLLFYIIILANVFARDISSGFTNVWGPGLKPDVIVTPARYFFIQAVDQNNIRYR